MRHEDLNKGLPIQCLRLNLPMYQDPRNSPSLTLEALHHVEQACAAFERDWRAGKRAEIEGLLGDADGFERSLAKL